MKRLAIGVLTVCALPAQEAAAVFEAPILPFDPFSAVHSVGDFDGDGDLDALGWWYQYYSTDPYVVRGYRNDGRGAFTEMFRYQTPRGTGYWAMDVGNFNGDARTDFVTWFDSTIQIRTMPNSGDPEVYATYVVGTFGNPRAPDALAVLDFDRDGRDDLVIVDSNANGLRFLRNTGSGLDAGPVVPSQVRALRVAELDGDSRPDVLGITTNAGFYQPILLQAGALTLGALIPSGLSGLDAMSVAGDIDGDRDTDIVTFSTAGTYRVLRRTGATTFTQEAVATGGPATGLADIDGDGDLDGVCCGGGSSPYWNIYESTFHIALNDGTGRFAAAWTIPNVGARRLAGAVDLDGDADTDLIAGRGIFFNRDSFRAAPQPLLGGQPLSAPVLVADNDGDGDVDVLPATLPVRRNDGTGALTDHDPYRPAPGPGGAYWTPTLRADVDGDGDLDVITAYYLNAAPQGMKLLRNVGNGELVDGGFAILGELLSTWNARVFADFDGDGTLDLWTSGTASPVWRNDGTGHFTRGPALTAIGNSAAADLDRDGRMDLVVRTATTVDVYWGNGDASFTAPTSLSFGTNGDGTVGILDIDGDGDLEIAVASYTRGFPSLFVNQGSRTFAEVSLRDAPIHGSGSSRRNVIARDFDGDGHDDLLINGALGTYTGSWLLCGDGAGGFAPARLFALDAVATGDMDGDGDVDVLTESRLVRGARFGGATAGARRQYGVAGVGAGGFAPTFGVSGPCREGSTVLTHVSGAPGGSLVSWVFAASAQVTADWPFPGMTAYAYPLLVAIPFPLQGNWGQAGTGTLRIAYQVPPGMAGVSIFQQMHVWDPSVAYQLNWTAGLETRFGR